MLQQTHSSVMVAEDDDLLRAFFQDLLTDNGYDCRSFSRCSKAMEYLAGPVRPPDLILSDINMPGMNGLGFLRAARDVGCHSPFVLVSGSYEVPAALDALENGAADYLLKPASPEAILEMVAKHVNTSPGKAVDASAYSSIERLSHHAAGPQLLGLLNSLCHRRIETLQHSRRVAAYAALMAVSIASTNEKSGVEPGELEIGALLHDIGKVGIPENVICKPGPLSSDEWRVIRMHPEIGFELLKAIPGLAGVAEIVYAHHESFDGTGYPLGKANDGIPLGARIFSVADAFDAMTSDRPYRKALSPVVARAEIKRLSGSQFDPLVVAHFLSIPDTDLEAIRQLGDDSGH
jgi:putative nucleotidyltransferase with HDIG domain